MAENPLETDLNQPSEAEKRIKGLSEQVKEASEGREAEAKARAEAETGKAAAEKKASFYKDFSKLSSKYSGAADHMDEIEQKVMSGYDAEDATVAVLNKAGKFQPLVDTQVAGGSSTTNIVAGATEKTINQMSIEEKRAALMEREGEVMDILGPRTRM